MMAQVQEILTRGIAKVRTEMEEENIGKANMEEGQQKPDEVEVRDGNCPVGFLVCFKI